MAGEKQATDKVQGGAPFMTNPLTGEVGTVWEVEARFVGFQAPRDWKMQDDRNPGQMRQGVTYRVDVRVAEGTVLMKVPEDVYQGMKEARLDFGDRIFVIYGRTVTGGEMRVAPMAFRKVS